MDILAQRYELRLQIGSGGMATVWEAWDTRLHRAVAVKLLARVLNTDPAFVARFQREARHAAQLNHLNIVTIFDFGTDDDVPYLVMELVVGESLGELLRREGRLEPSRTIEICQSVLSGLAEAHAHHIVHRDIKPSNVLIGRTGSVKIADFGIAHSLGDSTMLTDTGVLLGTVSYLSPEQCAGESATEQSDIYAVGCLAYQCLSGRPPFTGETPASIMYQHQHAAPVPIGHRRADLPPRLIEAIGTALQKAPQDRFATAGEMKGAIGPALAFSGGASDLIADDTTEVIEGTRPLPLVLTSTGGRSRRPLLLWALASVLLAVAVAAVALATHHGGSTPTSNRQASKHQSTSTVLHTTKPTMPPTTVAPANVTVSLPVVSCNTTYGSQNPGTPPPSSMEVTVPSDLESTVGNLSYYAVGDGSFSALGPAGWDCSALVGADGSTGLDIVTPSEAVSLSGDQPTASQDPQAITLMTSGGCAGCAVSQACGIFASANTDYARSLSSCTAPPAAETDINLTQTVVAFEDPADVSGTGQPSGGLNPANGVITYYPGSQNANNESFLMTCELPDSYHQLCTATLNDFIKRTWPY